MLLFGCYDSVEARQMDYVDGEEAVKCLIFCISLFAVMKFCIPWAMQYCPVSHYVFSALGFRVPATSFGGACPKRMARWYKCAKRCEKRCQKQTPEEECCFVKCAMNLVKLHLPPPLPLKPKKKSQKTVPTEKSVSTCSQDKDTVATEAMTAPASREVSPSPRIRVQQPVVPLIDLARMQYWQPLVQQVTRRGAKYRDSDGLYPLHWAVSGGPTLEAVRALLNAYPSAARKTDREGSTALHFATHYSASIPVVQAVLKAYPKSATVQDRFGRTPLYHAVEKTAGLDVLELLIQENPSAITLPCLPQDSRNVPMSRAVAQRTPLYMAWSAVLLDRKVRQSRKGRKWDKARVLLEAAYRHACQQQSGSATTPFNFVSAVINFDLYLPEEVLPMAVAMHPEHLATQESRTGRVPLLQAAASDMRSRRRSDEIISLLLEAHPAVAMTRDSDGKSALHLALESGKPWEAGVRRLFEANPDAIDWRDTSGLTPALSAATVVVSNNTVTETPEKELVVEDENPLGLLTTKEKELLRRRRREFLKPTDAEVGMNDTEQLSTILHLVLANPSVVSSARE